MSVAHRRARRMATGVIALCSSAVAAPALASTSIAVVGDPGSGGAGEAAVAAMVGGWAPDAVMFTGDNYYAVAGGSGTGRYDLSVGRYYCGFLSGAATGSYCAGGTATTNRLWPAIGNHDYSDAGIPNYLAYFSLPGNERYYDTRVGSVHLFVLDSDEMLRSNGEMAAERAWVEAGLRASTAPFQVVMFHHPPFSSGSHGSSTAMRLPFADWGADLVLNGHEHVYERLSSGGLTYVVNGIGSGGLTAFPSPPLPQSMARWSGTVGAMRMTATDTVLAGELVTTDGVVRDAFSVSAPSSGSPAAPSPGEQAAPAVEPPAEPALTPGRLRLVLRSAKARTSRTGRLGITVQLGVRPGLAVRVRGTAVVMNGRRGVGRAVVIHTFAAGDTTSGRVLMQMTLGAAAARLARTSGVVTVGLRLRADANGQTTSWVRTTRLRVPPRVL